MFVNGPNRNSALRRRLRRSIISTLSTLALFKQSVYCSDDEQIEQNKLVGGVLKEIAQCTGSSSQVYVDPCIFSNVVDLITNQDNDSKLNSEGILAMNDVRKEIATAAETCVTPKLETDSIEILSEISVNKCFGNIADAKEAMEESVKISITKILGENKCWVDICKKGHYIPSYKDNIHHLFHEVSKCAEIPFKDDSCLTATFIRKIGSDQTDTVVGQSIKKEELCESPLVLAERIPNSLKDSISECEKIDKKVDEHEIEELKITFGSILTAKDCWENACDRPHMNPIGEDEKHEMKKNVVEKLNMCADANLDVDSCLVTNTFDMVFYQAAAGLGGPQARHLLEDKTGAPSGMAVKLPCTMPEIDVTSLQNVVLMAQQQCLGEGSIVSDEEVYEMTGAVTKFFTDNMCWDRMCRKGIKDMFQPIREEKDQMKSLLLDYVLECSGVRFDENSCMEKSIFHLMLFDKGHNTKGIMEMPEQSLGMNGNVNHQSSHTFMDHNENSNSQENNHECGAPHFLLEEIELVVSTASQTCTKKGFPPTLDEKQVALEKLERLLNSKDCWTSICSDQTIMMLVAKWMRECANIILPLPILDPVTTALNPESYVDEQIVSCMINHVMASPPSMFGIEEYEKNSVDQCFVPGHTKIKDICPSVLAPAVLKQCLPENFEGHDPNTEPEYPKEGVIDENMSYKYDRQSSLSYDYGYDFDYGNEFGYHHSFSYDYDKDKTRPKDDVDYEKKYSQYISQTCHYLEKLSSEKGKQCLLPLCQVGKKDGEHKGSTPSSRPNLQPTIRPTPGDFQSTKPTQKPSLVPTESGSSNNNVPTPVPTLQETPSPTVTFTNAKIQVKFKAEIKLNMTDVVLVPGPELEAVVEVLEKSIEKSLSNQATVRILKIGGLPLSRRVLRSLQSADALSVEFEVTMEIESETTDGSDADVLSETIYITATNELQDAVSSGTLDDTLKEEAKSRGVTILENVTINKSSFSAQEKNVKITTKEDNGGSGSTSLDTSILKVQWKTWFLIGLMTYNMF